MWRAASVDASPVWAYAAALAMCFAYVGHLYPWNFFAGNVAHFDLGDASQSISGWLFYATDEWRFPLFYTPRFNHPEGTSIVFTDSIPLAAILFKPFVRWLPENFHYFGYWHALAYLLQALSATFLVRVLGHRSMFAALLATGFAITWPALASRFGHTGLLTHGLLIATIGLYFWGRSHASRRRRAGVGLITCVIVTFLVHPYLAVMCFGGLVAYAVDTYVDCREWRRPLIWLVAPCLAIAVISLVGGYAGPPLSESGYGRHSMNLAAPLCGGVMFNCTYDATGGQYEGYNYFGAGCLGLVVLAVCLRLRAVRALLLRYPGALAMSLVSLLFAVSNDVYFMQHHVVHVTLPDFADQLAGVLRASGRMFWIIGYLILFAALSVVLKLRGGLGVVIVAGALALQWYDLQHLRANMAAYSHRAPETNPIPWPELLSGSTALNFYPTFRCGTVEIPTYVDVQMAAARAGATINTGYISRLHNRCTEKRAQFDADLVSAALYVMPFAFYRETPGNVPAGLTTAISNNECRVYEGLIFCIVGETDAGWAARGLQNGVPVSNALDLERSDSGTASSVTP
jgi:hypothetical protein